MTRTEGEFFIDYLLFYSAQAQYLIFIAAYKVIELAPGTEK